MMKVISLRNPSAAMVALLVTTSATRAAIELDSFNLNLEFSRSFGAACGHGRNIFPNK